LRFFLWYASRFRELLSSERIGLSSDLRLLLTRQYDELVMRSREDDREDEEEGYEGYEGYENGDGGDDVEDPPEAEENSELQLDQQLQTLRLLSCIATNTSTADNGEQNYRGSEESGLREALWRLFEHNLHCYCNSDGSTANAIGVSVSATVDSYESRCRDDAADVNAGNG
jgi:hypothetical protein